MEHFVLLMSYIFMGGMHFLISQVLRTLKKRKSKHVNRISLRIFCPKNHQKILCATTLNGTRFGVVQHTCMYEAGRRKYILIKN